MNNWLKNLKVVEKHRSFFVPSIVILALGLVFLVVNLFMGNGALNLGIDFLGGSILNVEIGPGLTEENKDRVVDVALEMLGEMEVTDITPVQFTDVGEMNGGFTLRYAIPRVVENGETLDELTVIKRIEDHLKATGKENEESLQYRVLAIVNEGLTESDDNYSDPTRVRVLPETVSSLQSAALVWGTVLTVVVSILAMLIYIWFRFEIVSGVSAVVAILHDVLIMTAVMAILRVQINSNFIAAAITIVGISINNTIIVFDRVRENLQKLSLSNKSPTFIINLAVRETLVRTFNTVITTLFTVIPLTILGGPAIQEFSIPIMVGLAAGLYSSLFIAPTGWALYNEWKIKKTGSSEYLRKNKKIQEKPAKQA